MREKAPDYLAYVRTKGCLVCGKPAIAHHIQHGEPSAMQAKSGDKWAVPLCFEHHNGSKYSVHDFGNERLWWSLAGIDPIQWCEKSWREWANRTKTRRT